MAPAFHLRKWYMDMTTDNGACYIGYHAEIRFRKLRFGFTQHVFINEAGKRFQETVFRRADAPQLKHNTLHWKNRQYSGCWKNRQPGFSQTLFENKNGFIRWHVQQPLATVRLESPHGVLYGMGYSEQLEMTLPPWQLPVQELRWGRFVSEFDSVVWVNWAGKQPLQLICCNGELLTGAQFTDERISQTGFQLDMQNNHSIRSGEVGNTVFKGAGLLRMLVPVKAFLTHEQKWLGTGQLHAGNTTTNGLIIHERVTWK